MWLELQSFSGESGISAILHAVLYAQNIFPEVVLYDPLPYFNFIFSNLFYFHDSSNVGLYCTVTHWILLLVSLVFCPGKCVKNFQSQEQSMVHQTLFTTV